MSDVRLPDAVDRWETSGGTWRVSQVKHASVSVELLRCDGGEVVERLTLRDAQDLAWARLQLSGEVSDGEGSDRESSDDEGDPNE